jgi:hypothetical protein
MEKRTKLELSINSPQTFELLFDTPIQGESKYGPYSMYALADNDGKEFSFFAPDEVHAELSKFVKGDKVILTKTAEQKGQKVIVRYNVTLFQNGAAVDEAIANLPANIDAKKTNGKDNGNGNGVHIYDEGLFFSLMLQSFEEAQKIQNKIKGASLDRIAITLFIARTKQNGYSNYPA